MVTRNMTLQVRFDRAAFKKFLQSTMRDPRTVTIDDMRPFLSVAGFEERQANDMEVFGYHWRNQAKNLDAYSFAALLLIYNLKDDVRKEEIDRLAHVICDDEVTDEERTDHVRLLWLAMGLDDEL